VRHGISRDFQHAPHSSEHHAQIPDRMLPDERKRYACAFADASNTVRQLQIDLAFRWPSVFLPLVLDQLVITIQNPVRATEFGLAKTFPKVYADRSPGRSEVWKDHVITYDDRRDHN